jgi:hypothetical protein
VDAARSNGHPHPGEGPSLAERVATSAGAPPGGAGDAGVPREPGPGEIPGGSLAELRRERVALAERVAALTWDLGGLAYEMAVRDHYRLDVLARRAAELQQADAHLGEVERLLATAEGGVGGACRACGAVHSRGAAYCWQCGAPLLHEGRPSVLGEPAPGSSETAARDLPGG